MSQIRESRKFYSKKKTGLSFEAVIWRSLCGCASDAKHIMAVYRPDIPPHVAEIIRHLPPDLKREHQAFNPQVKLNQTHDGAPLLPVS